LINPVNPFQIWCRLIGCQANHVLLRGDRRGQGHQWRRSRRRDHRGGGAVPGGGQADDPAGRREQQPAQLPHGPDVVLRQQGTGCEGLGGNVAVDSPR